MTRTEDRPLPEGTAPEESARDPQPLSEAERVFCEFVRAHEHADMPAFEELCAARPELETELRRIQFNWTRVEPLLEHLQGGPSFGELLRRRYGSDIDPAISLDHRDSSHAPPGSGAERMVAKIAGSPSVRRYDVRDEVARGGMGAIYKIWDKDLRRTLAMKVMLQSGSLETVDERVLGRFLEEAQITGQLDHPGIVPVHDLGLDARGRVYFTMRLVRGVDLKEVLRLADEGDESWSRFRVLEVILRICEACAFAHSKGVVHRDLKPANVMVGRFGETYVMDWGLAKVIGRAGAEETRIRSAKDISLSIVRTDRGDESPDSPLVTLDGDVVGTPSYMSPEQAMGRLEDVGPRSDIYSVGSILYQLLSGQVPYVQADARMSPHTVLGRLLEGPPTPIQKLRRDVPEELVAICDKAMRRNPEKRYGSIMDLADDLRAFLEGRVVSAHQTGAVAEFRKWVSRNKALATASAAAVLIALLGLTGVLMIQVRARNEAEVLSASLSRANEQLEEAKSEVEARADAERAAAEEARRQAQLAAANEELARRRSYVNHLTAVDYSLRVNEFEEAKTLLEECEARYRSWEWRYLALRADTSLATFELYPRRASFAVFTADGSRVLAGRPDTFFDYRDADTGSSLVRTTASPALRAPMLDIDELEDLDGSWEALGPNRRYAAAWGVLATTFLPTTGRSSAFSLLVWDLAAGDEPQSRALANIALDDVDPGPSGGVPKLGDYVIGALAVSPSGLLAIGVLDRVYLYDPYGKELVGRLAGLFVDGPAVVEVGGKGSEVHLQELAFSPDGARLAAGLCDHSIRVFDLESGGEIARLPGHDGPLKALGFHATKPLLASASADQTVRVWDLSSGSLVTTLVGHDGPVVSIAFDGSGPSRIVSGSEDNTARVWDWRRGTVTSTLRGHEGSVTSVDFDPSGTRIVTGSEDATVKVWDPEVTRPYTDMNEIQRRGSAGGDSTTAAALGPRGQHVISGTSSGSVWLWDSATGTPLSRLEGPESWISAVGVGRDGSLLAAASRNEVFLWDAETEEPHGRLEGHGRRITDLVFLPDGRLVTSSLDETVKVWDPATGECRLTYEGHQQDVRGLAAGPDGGRVASFGSRRELHVWDPDTGELVREVTSLSGSFDSRIHSVALDPRGDSLAAGLRDGTLVVWDLSTGEESLRRSGDDGSITRLAYHPTESRLLAGTSEGIVQAWDSAWGERLLSFRAHARGIATLAFDATGERLLTCMVGTADEQGAEPPRVWETSSPAERRGAIRSAKTVRERVEPLVDRLFEELYFADAVRRRLAIQGDLSQAERSAALRLARLRGDEVPFLLEKGLDLVRGESADPGASIAIARRVLELDPGSFRAQVVLGVAHYHRSEMEEAARVLDAVLEEQPLRRTLTPSLRRHALLAELYRDVARYRADLADAPPDPDLLSQKCRWLLGQDETLLDALHYRLAEDLAREAVALEPDDPSHRVDVGLILYRRGDYGEALPVLEEAAVALRRSGEQADRRNLATWFLVLCNYRLGRIERGDEVATLLREGVEQDLALPDKVRDTVGNLTELLSSSIQLPFSASGER